MRTPLEFEQRIHSDLGEYTNVDELLASLVQPATRSVRMQSKHQSTHDSTPNPNLELHPTDRNEHVEFIDKHSLFQRVQWSTNGYYIDQDSNFKNSPAYLGGYIYPQEASSMIMDLIVTQIGISSESVILDLCAAPGGKSIGLLSTLPHSLIVANEIDGKRLAPLKQNLTRWGSPYSVITHNKPLDFGTYCHNMFDVILIDAPCSGEGMCRKDDQIWNMWSPKLVDICATRQKQIIFDSLPALKNGGYLIYSTCTFNAQENEDIVAWAQNDIGLKTVDIDVSSIKGITKTQLSSIHMLPHEIQGEGLTVSILQKPVDFDGPTHIKEDKPWFGRHPTNDAKHSRYVQTNDFKIIEKQETLLHLNQYINPNHMDELAVVQDSENYYALPYTYQDYIHELIHTLKVKQYGTYLGKIPKGSIAHFRPHSTLSFSSIIHTGEQEVIELDQESFIVYINKGVLTPSSLYSHLTTGFYIVSHNNYYIGYIKVNKDGSWTNLYQDTK